MGIITEPEVRRGHTSRVNSNGAYYFHNQGLHISIMMLINLSRKCATHQKNLKGCSLKPKKLSFNPYLKCFCTEPKVVWIVA